MSYKTDEEFKSLIPPLSNEEYKQLEENCVRDGIRDPLVVWEVPNGDQIIIDGHNRWNISARHGGIKFEVVKMHFDNREQVKEWIIKNQLGRRNIPAFVRAELILKLKPVIAKNAKAQQARTADNRVRQISDKQAIDTKKELAKLAGVSHDTIHKVEKIKEKASEEAKQALRRGEMSINQVYTGIMAAENQTKQQKQAQELRDAKKRTEEYEERKDDTVVSFKEIQQNKKDWKLIGERLASEMLNALDKVRILGREDEDHVKAALREVDKDTLARLYDSLDVVHKTVLEYQRIVTEVNDEE